MCTASLPPRRDGGDLRPAHQTEENPVETGATATGMTNKTTPTSKANLNSKTRRVGRRQKGSHTTLTRENSDAEKVWSNATAGSNWP